MQANRRIPGHFQLLGHHGHRHFPRHRVGKCLTCIVHRTRDGYADLSAKGALAPGHKPEGRSILSRLLIIKLRVEGLYGPGNRLPAGGYHNIFRTHRIDPHVLAEINPDHVLVGLYIQHLRRGLGNDGCIDLRMDRRHREIAVDSRRILVAVRIFISILRKLDRP